MTTKVDEAVTSALSAIMDDAKSTAAQTKTASVASEAQCSPLHARLFAAIRASWHISAECASRASFLYDTSGVSDVASPGLVYSVKRLMRALAAPEPAVQSACASALEALLRAVRTDVFSSECSIPFAILSDWMAAALSKSGDGKHCALSPSQEAARRHGVITGCRILLANRKDDQQMISPALLRSLLEIWCDSESLGVECLDIVTSAPCSAQESFNVLSEASARRHVSHARRTALAVAAWTAPLMFTQDGEPLARACDVIKSGTDAAAVVRRASVRSDRPGQLAPGAFELCAILIPRICDAFGASECVVAWNALVSIAPSGSDGLCESLVRVLVRARCPKLFTPSFFALVRDSTPRGPAGASATSGIAGAAIAACSLPTAEPEDVASVFAGVSSLPFVQPQSQKIATALLAYSRSATVLTLLSTTKAYREALHALLPALLRAVRREHIAASLDLGHALAACIARAYCVRGAGSDATVHLQSSLSKLLSIAPPSFDAASALFDASSAIRAPGAALKRAKRTLSRLNAVLESTQAVLSTSTYSLAIHGMRIGQANEETRNDTSVLCAAARIVSVARVAALVDVAAVKDVVRDLRRCVRNAKREPDAVCDALVEVLLLWLSRPSAAMRELADACFAFVLPSLITVPSSTSLSERPWMQSVMRVLSTAPSSADHEDMLGGDSDDDRDPSADRPPMPKRMAVAFHSESPTDRPVLHSHVREEALQSSDDSSNEEIIGDEDEAELAAFDERIAAVLAARREHAASRTMAARDLVVLKQRLLDWLPLVDREVSRSSTCDLWPLRLAIAVAVSDIATLHAPSPAQKSAERGTKRSASDVELVEKALGVIVGRRVRLAALPDTRFDGPALPAQDVVLDAIRSLISRSQSAACIRFRVATALFWMLCGASDAAKPGAMAFWDAAVALVASLARRTDNGPQSMLTAFLERPLATHAPAAAALIDAAWGAMRMDEARPFVRCRVLKTVDTVLQRNARAGEGRSWSLASHVAALYSSVDSSSVSHLRDDIAALHGVVARSRQHAPAADWKALWRPVIDRVSAAIDALPQADAQQRAALVKRLATTRALLV